MKFETAKLIDFASFSQGLQVPIQHQFTEYADDRKRFIRIVDITSGGNEPPRYIVDPGERYFVNESDLFMIRYGSPQVAKGWEGVIANNLFKIKLNSNNLDTNWLYYYLKQDWVNQYLLGISVSATMPAISFKAFGALKVIHPPLPTQSKIASILTAYDDLIENNLKRIKLLEEKAFLRYKQIVREEKMDEFLIEEVCETLGGGTPATGDRRFWDEGDILWFSPTDLTKHHSIVLLNSEKKITELGLQKSSAKLVPPKTILMTSRASIGYFGLINKSASTNQGFINIIPFNENHRAYMLFDLKNRKEEIIGNANGSTFLEISKGKFRQMKMKLPKDEKILEDFEREFEINFNFIENLLKQNNKLREARDILLPKLMNGQIEV
jgi:type I restriction enzyme S subunit